MAAPQQSLATVCNGSRAEAVTRESARARSSTCT